MENNSLNIFTSILFVSIAFMFSCSLYYVYNLKKNLNNNKETMYRFINDTEYSNNIQEQDRSQFITKCNKVNSDLERLMSRQLVNINNDHKQLLMEKKHYIKKIKDIVNDMTFNNKKEFSQLHSILKEIQNDVMDQNKRITNLEAKVGTGDNMKNDLANMLIQRMIADSSKRSIRKGELTSLLEGQGENKEEELKMLEKYIIKTIRKQLNREMSKIDENPQVTKPFGNIELERKIELMDLVNHKLRSMENLYRNLHSTNKKQIIEVVTEPVKKTIKPYVELEIIEKIENKKPKVQKKCSNKLDPELKVHRKDGEANTYYVTS
jgi:hypothetical protein